ncbi:MAG: hypothetical protein U0V74_09435 [Chitinophagales bacterium]
MRETLLFKILLYTHITSGMVSLVSGVFPMVLEKGGKIHRRAGLVFVIAMNLVAFSAFSISIITDNKFLLAIAVFSFYMNYMGYRVLKNRSYKFVWYDWAVVAGSAIAVGYMVSTLHPVLLVFGFILGFMIVQDSSKQLQGEDAIKEARRARVLQHISRMVGTYIATVTAFLVVNVKNVNPAWLPWLLPTFVGTPFITYWSVKWRKKLAKA